MSKDFAKLNKELNFIEESFKSGIITKPEYDVAKKRIEDKISLLKTELKEEPIIKEPPKVKSVLRNESHNEEKPIFQHHDAKPSAATKLEVYYGDKVLDNKSVQKEAPKVKKETFRFESSSNNKKDSTRWIIAAAALLIIIAIIYFLSQNNINQPAKITITEDKFIPVCTNDLECQKKGQLGICENPNTKDASCSYELDSLVNITLITSKKCILCDVDRTKNILTQLYPSANFFVFDMEDNRVKRLVSDLKLSSLPAAIFDSSLEDSKRFNSNSSSTKNTFILIKDKYILKPEAAGASYFLDKEVQENKVELFLSPISSTSILAYNNLMVLSKKYDFDTEISFYSRDTPSTEISRELCIKKEENSKLLPYLSCLFKKGVDESNSESCIQSLNIDSEKIDSCIADDSSSLIEESNKKASRYAINTLPVFIFNNQHKKGGSLSLDILEEIYCKLNSDECK